MSTENFDHPQESAAPTNRQNINMRSLLEGQSDTSTGTRPIYNDHVNSLVSQLLYAFEHQGQPMGQQGRQLSISDVQNFISAEQRLVDSITKNIHNQIGDQTGGTSPGPGDNTQHHHHRPPVTSDPGGNHNPGDGTRPPGGDPSGPPDHRPPHHHRPPGGDPSGPPDHQPPGGDPGPGPHPNHGIRFGGYSEASWHGNDALNGLRQDIGGNPEIEQFYRPIGSNANNTIDHIRRDIDNGTLPEVSLSILRAGLTYHDINNGSQDAWLRNMAHQMSQMHDSHGNPATIMVRPGWEQNLRWMQRAGSPEEFTQAFQHIHDIFRQEGANNVQFVWSPGHSQDVSHLGREANPSQYWPGANYVDAIGPDGYANHMNHFQNFNQLFGQYMDMAQRIGRPFMVSETGIDRVGSTSEQRVHWWQDMYNTLTARQRSGLDVVGIATFLRAGDYGHGFMDYRLDDAERAAIRRFLTD